MLKTITRIDIMHPIRVWKSFFQFFPFQARTAARATASDAAPRVVLRCVAVAASTSFRPRSRSDVTANSTGVAMSSAKRAPRRSNWQFVNDGGGEKKDESQSYNQNSFSFFF